jgi:hypothetical protein
MEIGGMKNILGEDGILHFWMLEIKPSRGKK